MENQVTPCLTVNFRQKEYPLQIFAAEAIFVAEGTKQLLFAGRQNRFFFAFCPS